jgi:anthranilate/para-aminobenzoate synthase component I
VHALLDFPGGAARRCRHAFSEPVRVLQADGLEQVAGAVAGAERLACDGAWVLGFVAYEAAPAFDRALTVATPHAGLPLAWFAAYDRARPPPPEAEGTPVGMGAWSWRTPPAEASAQIEAIRADIAAGRVYQVNLTTRREASFRGDTRSLFSALRRAQPDGYCLYLDAGAWQILSVSPELFFDRRADGGLTAQPMKGTAARGSDARRDAAAREALLGSAKEQAENLMIVDLLRNDMSRVAHGGTVRVARLFEAIALPTAWQMTSTIQCRLRAGTGLAEVFQALFPCGSVTGAPKIAAMARIRALEGTARGAYCGAIGVIRPGGHATFNVGIRTVTVDSVRGRAECGIGSGITWDSRAADEIDEWKVKARFLLRACGQPEG